MSIVCQFINAIGVGIFANDNPVANNTALLASNGSEFGTIYCTSGSRDPNIGLWYHHSGALITSDNGGKFDIEYGGVDIPSYAALRLKPGQVLDSDDEGVYTCVIPDHMAEQQILYVGIYRTDFFGELYGAIIYSACSNHYNYCYTK